MGSAAYTFANYTTKVKHFAHKKKNKRLHLYFSLNF